MEDDLGPVIFACKKSEKLKDVLKPVPKSRKFSVFEDVLILKYLKLSSKEKIGNLSELTFILHRFKTRVLCHIKSIEKTDKTRRRKVLSRIDYRRTLLIIKAIAISIEEKGCIDWTFVSSVVDVKDTHVKYAWYYKICTQLFAKIPIRLNKIRIKLIKILIKSNIEEWSDIKWKTIAEKFPGVTPHFLKLKFYELLICYVHEIKKKTVKDCLADLHFSILPTLKEKKTDYQLTPVTNAKEEHVKIIKEYFKL